MVRSKKERRNGEREERRGNMEKGEESQLTRIILHESSEKMRRGKKQN